MNAPLIDKPGACATGAGGVLPPTSKNVYDEVMVVTSLDNLGSIPHFTG
ncbi:MAG: hypothetical protein IPO19_22495 [Rhodoferax sp.]|nr:hypothetical protein [Rhodoferax sp.]